MKKIAIKLLYSTWAFLASKNLFPKLCERINVWINKLEK